MTARRHAPEVPTSDTPVWLAAALDSDHVRSRFADDVWDLRVTIPRGQNRNHSKIDFTRIDGSPEVIHSVKLFVWWRLNKMRPSRPVRHSPVKPETVASQFDMLVRYLAWLLGSFPLPGDADPGDVKEFVARFRKTFGRNSTQTLCMLLVELDKFRDDLPTPLTPAGLELPKVRVARRRRENATPRVPHEVMAPTLTWALWYSESMAPIIVEHLNRSAAHRTAERRPCPHGEARQAIEEYVEGLRRQGRPLPSHTGDPDTLSAPLVRYETGLSKRTVSRHLDHLRKLATDGDGDHPPMGLQPRGLGIVLPTPPAGQHPTFGLDFQSVQHELAMVVHAIAIVVIYLSGMRFSEFRAIRPADGLLTEPTQHGGHRYMIRSRYFKGRRVPLEGLSGDWVVIGPAHVAIQALVALEAAWLSTPNGEGKMPTEQPGETVGEILSNMNFGCKTLWRFGQHLNNRWATPGQPIVPTVDGETWELGANQLRRTLAWYIGHQPMGIVALKIQFKHLHAIISQGYIGTSPSGFPQEVEAEKAIAAELAVHAVLTSVATNQPVSLPDDLRSEFQAVAQHCDFSRGEPRILEGSEADRYIRNRAESVHLGYFNYCFYDATKALCWGDTPVGERLGGPKMHRCQPLVCQNSGKTEDHLPCLELDHDFVTVHLKSAKRLRPRPTPLIKTLEQRKADLETDINTLRGSDDST